MNRVLLSLALLALAVAPARAQRLPAVAPADAQATFVGVSGGLAFAENRGQWPDEVLFRARIGGADLWVTDDALVYDFYVVEGGEPDPRVQPERNGPEREGPEAATRRGHVVAMRFEGARAQRATGHDRQAAYHNYFLGSDPARWASHVPLYDEVVLEDLYAGVDLRLYADGGLPRYDLVLAPGADLAQVRMRLDGTDSVAITPEGSLRMETTLGPVEQRGLLAYQEGAAGRREVVESAFRLGAGGVVGFAASGADPRRPLVIDPLVWSTFLGGTNLDEAEAVAVGTTAARRSAGSPVALTSPRRPVPTITAPMITATPSSPGSLRTAPPSFGRLS